jgi:hypothetical protein
VDGQAGQGRDYADALDLMGRGWNWAAFMSGPVICLRGQHVVASLPLCDQRVGPVRSLRSLRERQRSRSLDQPNRLAGQPIHHSAGVD